MTRRGEWVHENSSGSFAYLANRIAYRRGAWNFARRIAVPEHVEEVRLCQRVCRPTTKTKRMTKKVMDPGGGSGEESVARRLRAIKNHPQLIN